MRLRVVLPTYDERENLPHLVTQLLRLQLVAPAEPGLAEPVELSILIVDDASPDGTGELADALAERHEGRVAVLHRPRKEGLGRAYLAGFVRALDEGADLILQMDCDFSHQPKYVADILAALPGADMVLASRFAPGGSVAHEWAWWRKLLSWFANSVYIRLILDVDIADATGGFRLWRRETLLGMDLAHRIQSNGYVFQVEMAYLAQRLGYRIVEVPIHFPDRVAGRSKMNLGVQMEAARRVFGVRRRHRSFTPADRMEPKG